MAEISIRRGVAGDERALALVGQASFLEAFAGVLEGEDVVAHCAKQHAAEKYAAWLADGCSALWLAEAQPGGAPVGYVVLTNPDLPLGDVTAEDREIKRVYLLYRFQGGGVGTRLMRAAEAHAQASGCGRVLLGVYAKNAAAIGFYQRLGYQKIGEREFPVGHRTYHDWIMARRLT